MMTVEKVQGRIIRAMKRRGRAGNPGGLTRSEANKAVGAYVNAEALDDALEPLLAAGVITVRVFQPHRGRAGRFYQLMDPDALDPSLPEQIEQGRWDEHGPALGVVGVLMGTTQMPEPEPDALMPDRADYRECYVDVLRRVGSAWGVQLVGEALSRSASSTFDDAVKALAWCEEWSIVERNAAGRFVVAD